MAPEQTERMRKSYLQQMRSADAKRSNRKTYSQDAMLAAHFARINEICAEVPHAEIVMLRKLDDHIRERAAELSKQLEGKKR